MKTRREFLLTAPLFLYACTQVKKSTMTEEEAQKLREDAEAYHKQMDKHLISEGHPIAQTFKYRMDGTTASANLAKSSRNGVAPEDQLCKTCMYYKAIGDDYGSCQMLPQGNVTSNGWCMSWTKIQNQMPAELKNG